MIKFSEFLNESINIKEIEKLLKQIEGFEYDNRDQRDDYVNNYDDYYTGETVQDMMWDTFDGNMKNGLKGLEKNIKFHEKKQNVRPESYIESVEAFLNRFIKKFK